MYIYIYTDIYTHTHTHTYKYIGTHFRPPIYMVCIYICHINVCKYTHILVYLYIFRNIPYMYTYMYYICKYTNIYYIYLHICIAIHICKCM